MIFFFFCWREVNREVTKLSNSGAMATTEVDTNNSSQEKIITCNFHKNCHSPLSYLSLSLSHINPIRDYIKVMQNNFCNL